MTQPNQPVEGKKVELPPAEVTISDAQCAEELMSTTYSGVMTIVAESFYYKRQLLSALEEIERLKHSIAESAKNWDHGLMTDLRQRAETAESRLSQLFPREPIQSFDEWWSANVHLMAVGSESWAKATARAAWNAREPHLNQSESSWLAEKERDK